MSNADWWAKKLGQPVPQGRPDPSPAMPPSQQPMQVMPSFQQAQPDLSRLAPSSKSTASCPDCGSGNFMAPTPQIAPRCYDCGYPVQQSGSRFGSLTGAHVEGTTQQAAGNDTSNNWNPQGIIGHV
jgi:ribosomal protein S27AE